MSLKKKQRNLWFKYILHMHDTLMDLYVSYQSINPFKLLILSEEELRKIVEKRRVVPLNAQFIVQFILQLYRLKAIVEELVEIIDEANMMLLHKRIYNNIEEWQICGIIDWPNALRNIVLGKPIAQKIIGYTISSPENLLLRAVVDYTCARLENIINKFEKIKKEMDDKKKISIKAQRGLHGLRFLERTINECKSKLETATYNSFLTKIPSQLYTTESLEPIWELMEEVEATPWRPEWVNRLLDLVYTYYTSNRLEKELERIVDLIIDRLVKEPMKIDLAFKVYSYKLYEIYNLYVILKALSELGADIDLIAPKTLQAKINGKTLVILYNRIADEILKTPITAIPDTMIKNKETIIIEAKFSRNPSYLSQAVFKVISYITLFKAKIGILTYPSVRKKPPIEEEDKQIYETILTNRYKEIPINTDHKEQKIIVLQLEPLKEQERTNISIVKNIIEQVV